MRRTDFLFSELDNLGFLDVNNFEAVDLMDRRFRMEFESGAMGFEEVDMIRSANPRGFFTPVDLEVQMGAQSEDSVSVVLGNTSRSRREVKILNTWPCAPTSSSCH